MADLQDPVINVTTIVGEATPPAPSADAYLIEGTTDYYLIEGTTDRILIEQEP